jgi:putative ABC transport system permease protein
VTGLAWRSVRARRTAFAATALSVLLGTAVLIAFLTLLETGLGSGVSSVDKETLLTMAAVVGGWDVVIAGCSRFCATCRSRSE